jgi:hypothetical protein
MLSWAFACDPENIAPTLNQEEPIEDVLIATAGVLVNQEEDDAGFADVLVNQEEAVLALEGAPNQEGPPLKKEVDDVAALCGALTNNGFVAC